VLVYRATRTFRLYQVLKNSIQWRTNGQQLDNWRHVFIRLDVWRTRRQSTCLEDGMKTSQKTKNTRIRHNYWTMHSANTKSSSWTTGCTASSAVEQVIHTYENGDLSELWLGPVETRPVHSRCQLFWTHTRQSNIVRNWRWDPAN